MRSSLIRACGVLTCFLACATLMASANDGPGADPALIPTLNDAPVLDATISPALQPATVNAGAPVGAVGSLVASLVDYASPAGQVDNVSDLDIAEGESSVLGIAIIAANTSNGTWWYSINNGTSWAALGSPTTFTARLLLADANARVYFQPTIGFSGSLSDALTIRAWDQSNGQGSGSVVSASATGGTQPYSAATDLVSIQVNPLAVSNAPVLNAAATPVLASQNEDSGAPSGAVGTLVSSLVDFATPTGQLDNVTDADAGALLGIAITAVDVSQGSWWYTTNSGASWSAVGAVSSGSARLLNADAATRIYFQPNANFNGTIAAAITFRAWDRTSGSNGGTANTLPSGGNTAFSSATDVSALTVISVNDVPTATNVSAAETYTEDVALNLIDIVVSDADNATITATLTLSNTNAGSLNTATSGAVTSTYVAGTGVWTASGAIANVNTLLAGLTFTPASNFNGDFTIATSVSDGIAPAITGSKTMTGIAVNDAPQAVSLGEYGGTEDEGAPNASSGTSIGTIVPVVGLDPDAGAVRGIAIIAIDGTIGSWFYTTNNGTTWTPLGAVSATSARLLAANGSTRIHLQPNANLNGNLPAAITYRAWDQTSGTNGGTADVTVNGGSTAFSATPAVAAAHLFAINDAPVNVVPGAQSTSEETARVFSSGNGNAITVTDVDAASSAVRVTLTATNGTLTLAGLAGLSFTAGDGTGDATMTFTGTLPDINAALNGLSFAPALNYNGSASLTVGTNDQGATGVGGALSDTDVITITVTPVNDAPQLFSGGQYNGAEDEGAPNSGNGMNSISSVLGTVIDPDAGALSGLAIMAINGTIGTWFYSTNSGSSWNALGAVSATSARLLANNAGTRLYLQTNANFNGDVPAAITFRAWDQTSGTNGGTADVTVNGGTTAFSTATAVALAHLLAINDAPVNTVPGAQITSEDTPRVFSSGNGNGVTVTDVDAASSAVRVTLTVTNGTLTLAGLAGLSFTVGDGTGDATMTFTGTLTNMNAALNGLSFAPTLNYNGPANLTVATNDQGATGIGGAMSDTDVIAITVTAVNDAPVITGTAPPLATVDVPYSYDANVADVDGPGQSWTLLPAHTCGGTINPSTGEFFFTPIGPAPPSSCVVAIQVCDGGTPNLCATQSATVTIGLDADGDGVGNGIDNCPTVANAGQEDADGDGVGNVCDICAGSDDHLDADADGVPNGCDVCAGSNDLLDADFDGVPNGCDVCAGSNDHLDADFDGVPDGCDICAGFDDHLDADADGVPNGCDICAGFDDDLDADADGVPNGCDVCAGFDDDLDTDGDGVPNGCDVCAGFDDDLDTDGDGIPNGCDVCPGFPDNADADADGVPNGCDICAGFPDQLDADLDGVPNGCDICAGSNDHLNADGDALPDGCDNCPLVTNDGQQNFDGDALGDVCDPDDDNDGLSDVAEGGLGTDPQDPDSDDDGVGDAADNCPTVFGQVGSICDADAGPAVIPGTLNSSCTCVPVTGCTQNLTLEFQTDANPGQITWEIRQQGTNNLVQSGGPLAAPSGIQTVNTCVPDGCYYLRVLDAGGDGILGGGYILRTAGSPGIRLIDDRNNFSTGSVSAIAANEGFCFPLGTTTKPIFTSCDKLDWVSGDYLVCDPVASVSAQYSGANAATSGYEFWIFNPNGGYSFRKFRSHTVSDGFAPADASRACHIKLNNWLAASWIPANVLMNVRVRTRIADVNGNWGPACRMKIDAVRAACPLTKLMDVSGSSQFSCNVTRTFATSSYIYARPVTGANKYQFRFRIDGEGFVTVRNSNNYICQLNWSVSPLQDGRTYQVEVRASKDNGVTWCIDVVSPVLGPPFTQWGDVCDLTIDNTPMGGGNENLLLEDGSAQRIQLYPNPNRGDQLHLTFEFPEDVVVSLSNHTVSVDIYDLFGKRVSARTIAVQPLGEGSGGFINTVLELNGELAGGMYMVNIVAGGQAFTERLVIQK